MAALLTKLKGKFARGKRAAPRAAPDPGLKLLLTAVEYGRDAEVRAFVEKNGTALLDLPGDDFTPSLALAAKKGFYPTAKLLLDLGADVNAPDTLGFTPLHFAACDGKEELLGLLLAHGADVSRRDDDGWTALHCAASRGKPAAVEILLKAGAPVDALTNAATGKGTPTGSEGRTARELALRNKHPDAGNLLELAEEKLAGDREVEMLRHGLTKPMRAAHKIVLKRLKHG